MNPEVVISILIDCSAWYRKGSGQLGAPESRGGTEALVVGLGGSPRDPRGGARAPGSREALCWAVRLGVLPNGKKYFNNNYRLNANPQNVT